MISRGTFKVFFPMRQFSTELRLILLVKITAKMLLTLNVIMGMFRPTWMSHRAAQQPTVHVFI